MISLGDGGAEFDGEGTALVGAGGVVGSERDACGAAGAIRKAANARQTTKRTTPQAVISQFIPLSEPGRISGAICFWPHFPQKGLLFLAPHEHVQAINLSLHVCRVL